MEARFCAPTPGPRQNHRRSAAGAAGDAGRGRGGRGSRVRPRRGRRAGHGATTTPGRGAEEPGRQRQSFREQRIDAAAPGAHNLVPWEEFSADEALHSKKIVEAITRTV